jgi:hypothetical protein
LVTSFAADDWQACRDHVRDRLGLERFGSHREDRVPVARPVRKLAEVSSGAEVNRPLALELWGRAGDPQSTLAEVYLRSRGLILEPELAGRVLRFDPRHPWRDAEGRRAEVPALVALMRHAVTNEPCAIHRTALRADGSKLGRLTLGPTKGAAIKLDPDYAVAQGLGIGEGLETCLAVRQRIDWRPVWSMYSAGNVAGFPVLAGIDALTIFADHDASGTGQRAAAECSARWRSAGRECGIYLPAGLDRDFADEAAA